MGGGEETQLSTIRLFEMKVLQSEALDMNQSPHLIIDYMANFIKLAICNMPKVQTSHSKPLKSHLQWL